MIWFLIFALAAGIAVYAVVLQSPAAKKGRGRGRNSGGGRRSGGGYQSVRLDPGELAGRWDVIMATSRTGASGLKSAITEADKLFDYALRGLGLPGDTFADRLKAAKSRFSSYPIYDAVWRAHKLRNSLAHDLGFDLVVSQANEALRDFERGLKDLGALR